jgi:hypothetical protein
VKFFLMASVDVSRSASNHVFCCWFFFMKSDLLTITVRGITPHKYSCFFILYFCADGWSTDCVSIQPS